MKTGFRRPAAFAVAAFACVPATLQAADAELIYDKNYQCGTEIIQVGHCRRDSDTPDLPPTDDANNFCQVYYLDRPKNAIGGTAFGIELRSDLEKRLRACGALAGDRPVAAAPRPATQPSAAPSPARDQALAAYNAGAALVVAKNYTGAIEAFKKSIAIHPIPAAWNDLGNTYYTLGRYAEAIAAYQQSLALNSANSNAQAGIGKSYVAKRQYAEALPYLREALRLKPDLAWVSDMLGASYHELGKYEEATRAYREAIRLQPATADYHVGLASALWYLKRFDESLVAANEAVRLDPQSHRANNVQGNTLSDLKRYPEAIKAYQEAVRLSPAAANYRTNLGITWRLVKQPEKGLADLKEAVRLDPKLDVAWNSLGLCYSDLERDTEALVAFQKAFALKPEVNNYRYNVGFTLTNLGRLQEATQVAQALAARTQSQANELRKLIDSMSGRLTLAMKPVRPAGARNPKIELVWVAPGSFTMGGGFNNSLPAHKVTIATGFFIGKYEITQAQWKAVMGGNPSSYPNCGDNCPVEQVTWEAAQVFVKFLNDGNDGYVYRLPSEAEWEYAFRAGTTGQLYAEGEIGWNASNSGNKTHPVGQLKPNALGLYDIAGNVGEWCSDAFHANYEGAPADGRPWLEGGDPKKRVTRGGTFVAPSTSMNATTRLDDWLDDQSRTNGLRVVAVKKP